MIAQERSAREAAAAADRVAKAEAEAAERAAKAEATAAERVARAEAAATARVAKAEAAGASYTSAASAAQSELAVAVDRAANAQADADQRAQAAEQELRTLRKQTEENRGELNKLALAEERAKKAEAEAARLKEQAREMALHLTRATEARSEDGQDSVRQTPEKAVPKTSAAKGGAFAAAELSPGSLTKESSASRVLPKPLDRPTLKRKLTLSQYSSMQPTWSAKEWARSLEYEDTTAASILGDALRRRLGADNAPLEDADVFERLKRIASTEQESGVNMFRAVVSDEQYVFELARLLYANAVELHMQGAATPKDMHDKFMQGGEGFELSFGNLDVFFGGLPKMLGHPKPTIDKGLEDDHCRSSDSGDNFIVDNYGTETTTAIEYWCGGTPCTPKCHANARPHPDPALATMPMANLQLTCNQPRRFHPLHLIAQRFVVAPSDAKLKELGIQKWPVEDQNKILEGKGAGLQPRQPLSKAHFQAKINEVNNSLAGTTKDGSEPPRFLDAEFYSIRLYTGPMFVK